MSNELTLKELLEAGAHFGHQTYKWNPKMKKYIYGERNGIYVIDVSKTIPLAKKAFDFIKKTTASGKSVLFVGTKRQASAVIEAVAKSCGAFYVTHRWLGGMLTNYKTISLSVDKLRKVEKMKEVGDFSLLTKKEQSKIEKDVTKLEKNLGGIRNMRKLPGAIFVVDPEAEKIAIKEANHLGIPVVAIADTNCNPDPVDYVIPANDDAIKSITLFAEYIGKSVESGSQSKKFKEAESGTQAADSLKDKELEKEILDKFSKDIDLQD